ncbi:MAG TPA: hypothetical protein DD706_07335 [Nitrospiraceae bacterium]|nr:hypothetical protein [Nitrospiraceae bacterium]
MDLYSRAIVGWAMHRWMTHQLVCDSPSMALLRRGFPKETLLYSDRGSQDCPKRYQRLMESNGTGAAGAERPATIILAQRASSTHGKSNWFTEHGT